MNITSVRQKDSKYLTTIFFIVTLLHVAGIFFANFFSTESSKIKTQRIAVNVVSMGEQQRTSFQISLQPVKRETLASVQTENIESLNLVASPLAVTEEKSSLKESVSTNKPLSRSQESSKKQPATISEKPREDKAKTVTTAKESKILKEKDKPQPASNSKAIEKAVKNDDLHKKQAALAATADDILAQIENGNSSSRSSGKAQTIANALPKMINLNIDSCGDTVASGNNALSVYQSKITESIQSQLKLPEIGTVTVKIILTAAGKIEECKVITTANTNNKVYLERILPIITLPKPSKELLKDGKFSVTLTFANN